MDYLEVLSLDMEEQAVSEAYMKKWRINAAIEAIFWVRGSESYTIKNTGEQLRKSRLESRQSAPYTEEVESRVFTLLRDKFQKTVCKEGSLRTQGDSALSWLSLPLACASRSEKGPDTSFHRAVL